MCGIAGFSLSERSTINARELGHRLLAEIQWRGSMASGWAYSDTKGNVGYHKDATPGGQLSLKTMPRDAKTAIFHTRLTTHGSEQVNENNHPVISPNNKLALVHNGVIWNEQDVRADALKGIELPEVDTSVIAGVIQFFGLEGISELSGDAAIAWLESGKKHADALNIARLESSPLAYTWLLDGSFIFASTPTLLMDALDELKLEYGAVFTMAERTYFQVVNGIIMEHEITPEMKTYNWGYSYYSGNSQRDHFRQLTSGGHGSEMGSSFNNHYDPETETWSYQEVNAEIVEDAEDAEETVTYDQAMALIDAQGFDRFKDEYYTVDTDGDFKTYKNLDALENELKWYAALHKGQDMYDADGLVRWVEHFVDIGSFELDGTTTLSWVDDPNEVFMHEDPNGDGLSYIREGIGFLQRSLGA